MANRYWVGGTGTWNGTSTTNWSTTSGGASGASVPTSADNVFFDSASSGASYTVTMATATAVCANLSFAAPATGSVTWAGTSAASIYGDLTIAASGVTRSYNGTITFLGTGSFSVTTNGVSLSSNITFNNTSGTWTLGSALTFGPRNMTLTAGTLNLNGYTLSGGSFIATGSTTRTLTTGGATINVTGTGTAWSCATLTNMTYTTIPVVNVTNGSATATTVQNGTGGVAENLSVSYNFTGGTYALTLSGTANNIDFTGYAGTVSNNLLFIYGNLTLSTGWSRTAGTNAWIFRASTGPKTITTAGRTIDFPLTFSATASAGSWQLQDALTMGSTRDVGFTNGTLDLNGKTLTTGAFGTNAGTKDLTFNGGSLVLTAVATGTFTQSFSNGNPTGFTTTAGAGVGTISLTAAAAKTFAGNGSTFNCTLNQGGAGALTITGSNTFSNITNTVQPSTVLFTSGTTNTFSAFSLSGTVGNLVTIGSVTAGSQHTLSKPSGTVSVNYCTISDSAATGGATWNAFLTNGNVDGGNNTGWIFIPTLNVTLFPPLVTNANAFYTATITAGPINLAPNLYSNTNLFYGATITAGTVSLFPPLLSNTNAFYSAAISQTLPPTAEADIFVEIRSFTERRRF